MPYPGRISGDSRAMTFPLTHTDSERTLVPNRVDYQQYPFNLESYNPLTEWGEHYERIFRKDLWPAESEFDVLDVTNGRVVETHVRKGESIDPLLQTDPDLRIFYCDSKLCADLVTRASFSVSDIKKIFTKYGYSIIFLDRFIGRNRPTVGSRKLYDRLDTTKMISYDLWYDLPCRIYTDENDYDCHFILFTVYVHYDCLTRKTVMFYIHRAGSENPGSASRSSRDVKTRIRTALEMTYSANSPFTQLTASPFAAQMPTITCSVIFWTETLHKERLSMWKVEDECRTQINKTDTAWLHNVSRYIHSYKTNIIILRRTLELVRDEHIWFAKNLGDSVGYSLSSPWFQTIADAVESQIFQTHTITTFSDEVLERTQILINMYFNKMSEMDSKATANIAVETRRDAVSMRTVAIVTLFFLPATFVSAFFSMTFFNGSSSNSTTSVTTSGQGSNAGGVAQPTPFVIQGLWIYAVVTIPLTALVLGVWWLWHSRNQDSSTQDWEREWKSIQARANSVC